MRILMVLFSFLLFSCNKKQNDKLIVIINDFEQINNSKRFQLLLKKIH